MDMKLDHLVMASVSHLQFFKTRVPILMATPTHYYIAKMFKLSFASVL